MDEKILIAIEAINKASAELKRVSDDILGVGTSASKAEGGLAKFSKGMKSLGSELRSVGTGLTIGLTAPIVLLGKSMLQGVANIEQYKIAFETMLGSAEAAGKTLNELQKFAAKTPFDIEGVVSSSKLLLAMGVAAEELLPTLKSVGDVAAGVSAPFENIALAYGQVRAANQLYGTELRQFVNNGVPLLATLAEQFGKTEAQVKKMVEEGQVSFDAVEQAFVTMTSEGGIFFNFMDRQAGTLKGILSNIRDNFLRVSLAVLGFSTAADETFGNIIEGGIFDKIKDAAQVALDAMTTLAEKFGSMSIESRNLVVELAALAAALGPASIGLSLIASILGTLTSPIGLIVVGLAALGVAAVYLARKFDISFEDIASVAKTVFDFLKGVFEKLSDAASATADWFNSDVAPKLQNFFEGLVLFGKYMLADFITIWNFFSDIADTAWSLVKTTVGEGFSILLELLDLFGNVMKGNWSGVWGNIVEIVKSAFKIMLEVIESGIQLIAFPLNKLIDGINLVANKFGKSIPNIVIDFEVLRDAIDNIGEDANLDDVDNTIKGWGASLESGASAAGDLSAVVYDVGASFEDYGACMETAAEETYATGNVVDELGDLFGDLTDGLFGTEEGLSGVGGAASSAAEDTKDLQKQVKDLTESLVDLGVLSVTFDDMEEGLDALNDLMNDLIEQHSEFEEIATETWDSIQEGLDSSYVGTEKVIENYDDLAEVMSELESTIDDLKSAHQDFIDEAQEGLDEYGEKIKDINEEYDDMVSSATESAAESLSEDYVAALERRKELVKEISDTWNEYFQAATGEDALAAKESIEALNDELDQVDATIENFNTLSSGTDFTKDIEEATALIEDLKQQYADLEEAGQNTTSIARDLEEAERNLLILKGKQQIAQQGISDLEQAAADAKAEQALSEEDYIAYQLGQELDAIEKARQAEIDAANDLKAVQDAIVQGTLDQLDLTDLTDEAKALAEEAILERDTYKASLDEQLALLEEYKADEATIYETSRLNIENQQLLLQQYLTASYDVIIAKLNEMQQAALAAAAALGGTGVATTPESGAAVPGFAKGGFTSGALKQIAGVVHGGEWVAPNWMVKGYRPIFSYLEGLRKGKFPGFAEGGHVGSSITNKYHQPINMNNVFKSELDYRTMGKYLKWKLRTR